ncbi:uncharacterized protein H6S33_007649 [Morchella sextelata]|uniref:uncharacterized protein n=1 Tax=Morchella sextelata TaxID=1174677 RepID=UPI001D0554B6|nr:uncharacterized protein H6S33_007649 [Morchella sextelata]KAH0603327.1 hypothetical protein H6S33_007649 [Morchella sextelata]
MTSTTTSVIVAATAHDDLNHVPTLPPTTNLSYLAEGAANVIYRLSSPPGAPQYPNQLLRLRKALPSAQPNKLAYAHLLHTFHPLFPSHLLLPTSLIRIPPSLLARENIALHALEAADKRPAKRAGLYLEEVDEQFGFLITDMSPHPLPTPPSSPSLFARALSYLPGRRSKRSSDPDLSLPAHAQRTRQLLIEFKPKWVLQSRSAPDGWRRCRTCALRLSKQQKRGFCPLDLASGDEARVRRAVAYIVPAKQPANLVLAAGVSWAATQGVIADRIVRYVLEGDLMVELKKLHAELDPHGPVAVQGMGREVRERFVSAMTVRDLTVFLRIDLDRGEGEGGGVEARIGDLDLKTGDAGKWAYWAGVEGKLREEGYYGGTEEGAEEKGVWCRP